MTIEKAMFPAIVCIVALSCSPGGPQGSDVSNVSVTSLPSIKHGRTNFPYIRYSETTGQSASHGRAFFLYPIKERKTEILALEYTPGMKIDDLFGEELLGNDGDIINDQGRIAISFLPISIPVGIASDQEWPMQYADRKFVCRSKDAAASARITVSCISTKYSLSFVFDRELGVTEFQDFCGFSICTYKTMDSQGLLSRAMMRSIDFPNL